MFNTVIYVGAFSVLDLALHLFLESPGNFSFLAHIFVEGFLRLWGVYSLHSVHQI